MTRIIIVTTTTLILLVPALASAWAFVLPPSSYSSSSFMGRSKSHHPLQLRQPPNNNIRKHSSTELRTRHKSQHHEDLDIASLVDEAVGHAADVVNGTGEIAVVVKQDQEEEDEEEAALDDTSLEFLDETAESLTKAGDDGTDGASVDAAAADSTTLELSDTVNEVQESLESQEEDDDEETFMTDEERAEAMFDREQMQLAIELAQSVGGERGSESPFPKPLAGAVLVTPEGRVLGRGRSDYRNDCVVAAITDAGLAATPLREWCVTWPSNRKLREDLARSTLYITMEPSAERQGSAVPPMTRLIQQAGIQRVVIGCADPVPERATEGAASLHKAGIQVSMGVMQEECQEMIAEYTELANSKLHVMARKHFKRFGKPLGFLHCSVVDSVDVEAFARQGNAFGKNFGGKTLSFRDFGSYEIAPPPERVWAPDVGLEEEDDFDMFDIDFDEEEAEQRMGTSPMMPWFQQVDAVLATFPKADTGPANDAPRINGIKWLATIGEDLPANVERILVMDATDLKDVPLTNDHPSIPRDSGMDVEKFWRGENRKPTRVLLRKGEHVQAQAAAKSAAAAAKAAAEAAQAAMDAVESGDAAIAAEAALECQEAAAAATKFIQEELEVGLEFKRQLTDMGVVVETINGVEVIDVMRHLGKRNGYHSVVWRAGCWGNRGPKAVLDGAFQWVSAHLAVDAVGGKFWQLMLAERAVQAALGSESKVKVFAEQEDISLEYCDEVEADEDCVLTVDGRPVRHVRLDLRVALVDANRPREFRPTKTAKMTRSKLEEEAPWFL